MMKKTINIVLLLCAVISLISCSKGTEECQTCGIMPVDKVLGINIGNIDKTFNLWKNDGRNNTNEYCILDAKNTINSDEILSGMEILGLNGSTDLSTSSLRKHLNIAQEKV